MPANITPTKFQAAAHAGHLRLSNFRSARLLFLRNYTGPYYDRERGKIGDEALNMILTAIRAVVPNIVMNFPRHEVESRFLAYKEYAELLSLALSHHDKRNNIKDLYRQCIVDALFTLGISKTGLAESDSVYAFDDYDRIDAGEVYTARVDFDNLVVDPNSTEHLFRDAAFIGDKMSVPRQVLLDSGLYRNDLVERLPSTSLQLNKKEAVDLSTHRLNRDRDARYLREEVSVMELWVPGANAIITIPGDKEVSFEDYLRVDDYYGPDSGPYSFLALNPPVPGNPIPVPSVGVWNDLHVLGNRMAAKIIQQAERQKDILAYSRRGADDAESLLESGDGEAVAVDDPSTATVLSFGGQQGSNEAHLASLMDWFNQMSSNPQALAGQRFDAGSATEAKLLQQNASVGLEDMKDMVYLFAAEEASKRAWYFHTDPFINLPLVRRVSRPPQFQPGPNGPQMVAPGVMEDEQVFLTPEARSGDFLDFNFSVTPESMGRKDASTRFMEATDFAVKILPAAMQAAQTAAMLGLPFSPQAFVTRMAKDRGIDWIEEVFFDPQYQMQMAMMMAAGPRADGTEGTPAPAGAQTNPMVAIMQNGQPGQVAGTTPSEDTRDRQGAQLAANPMQSILAQQGA